MKVKFFLRTFVTLAAFVWAICGYAENFQTVDGQTISSADLKGKWVIINYWASWCPACRAEIPDFNAFYRSHKSGNVLVLGVNHDDAETLPELRAAVKKVGIKFPVLTTDPGSSLGLSSVSGLPTTFVLNPSGKIAKVLVGTQGQDALENAIS